MPKKFSELAVKSAGTETASAVSFVKQRSSTGESTVRPQFAGSLMVVPSPPPVQKQYSVWRRTLTQSMAVAQSFVLCCAVKRIRYVPTVSTVMYFSYGVSSDEVVVMN